MSRKLVGLEAFETSTPCSQSRCSTILNYSPVKSAYNARMPTKREDYNGYMREYMKRRYHLRMAKIIAYLGGKCARCPSKTALQVDHVDPTTKKFTVAQKGWNKPWEALLEELTKCQLLCDKCHTEKTVVEDLGRKLARGTHGTLSAYRYCKCQVCRATKRASNKEQRLKKSGGPSGILTRQTLS